MLQRLLLVALVPTTLAQLFGQVNQAQVNRDINEILENGKQVVEQSRIKDVGTRLCTCVEQNKCVEHMQGQTRECSKECFVVYNKLASNPQAMYHCAEQNEDLLTGMVSCLVNTVDSCSNSPTDRQIQKSNIAVMLESVDARIRENKARFKNDQVLKQIPDLTEATMEYGLCVKNCFIRKNRQEGACFDHFGCQPFITPEAFSQASHRCSKLALDEFKSRAQQMCNCAQAAGIRSTYASCTTLNIASGIANQGGILGGIAKLGIASQLGGR